MKYCILTHYDLDGAVSAICAKKAFPSADIDFLNYTNVEKTIEGFISSHFGEDTTLFILDFRIGLAYLDRLLSFNEFKVVVIDHHVVEEEQQVVLDRLLAEHKGRFLYICDKSKAAALNCYEFFGKMKPMTELAQLVYLTDTYDRWQEDRSTFKQYAVVLNEVFWKLKANKFIATFENGWEAGKDDEYARIEKEFEASRSAYMEDAMANHSFSIDLPSGRRCLFVVKPGVDYINLFTIYYPDYDYYFMYKSKDKDTKASHVSVRLRKSCPTTIQEIASEFEKADLGITGGGHLAAGGIVFPESVDIEEFFETAAEIVGKIDEKYK